MVANGKDLRIIKFQSKKQTNTRANGNRNSVSQFEFICDFADSKQTDFDQIVKNTKTRIVYDYIIDGDANIQPNMAYLMLKKANIWNLSDNPVTLNLNYWLKKNDKTSKLSFRSNNNSIPFSIGQRDCLGQTLARKELQAFLGNLILKYQIEAPNNDPCSLNIKYSFGELTFRVVPEIGVQISNRAS